MADRIIETDVLIMGGGIGGCPAACKAAEHGLNVTLVEKAKTERSGQCAMGRDEIQPFTRDGVTALDIIRQTQGPGGSRLSDPNVSYRIYDNSMWTLEELERLGVSMRYLDGEYHWTNFLFSVGGAKLSLQVPWLNVKPEMAAAVRKRGVNVLDRTMVLDLLTNNGKVAGATAVNTRTGEFFVIKSKAVVIAAGGCSRHFNPETPAFWKYKMMYDLAPFSGDAQAVAYRAGIDIASLELLSFHNYRDPLCLRPCHFGEEGLVSRKLFTAKGEEFLYSPPGSLEAIELERKNLLPYYLSLEDVPEDFHKRIEAAIVHERLIQFKLAEDRGFNPRTHRWETGFYSGHYRLVQHPGPNGLVVDENLKCSLTGVYAIGDCTAGAGGGLGSPASGFLVGNSIHKYVNEAGEPVIDKSQVESQKQIVLAPLAAKDGVEPMELECAVRYIVEEYAGVLKSEGKMQEGLKRLGSLKRMFLPKLIAPNPHYLMRCLEVRNIIEMAELYIKACLTRRESRRWGRSLYLRIDYPEKDPSMDNKHICQRMENGKAVLEIKELPDLKPEYANEKK